MKRSLLISLAVAALPAAGLGLILLAAPREEKAPVPAPVPESSAEKTPDEDPLAGVPSPESQVGQMRELLDRICREEDRMAARVRRVLDAPEWNSRHKARLLSELAYRSGTGELAEASEMLDAAHGVPSGPLRIALYSGVLQARVDRDPAGTLKLCGVLHEAEDRHAARQFVVRHWAGRDFRAAALALGKLDFPEDRLLAARGLLEAARSNPAELARLLAERDVPTEVAAPLAAVHAEGWKGGFDELRRSVAASSRAPVMNALAAGQAARNPDAVLAYLCEYPERRLGETAVGILARALVRDEAGKALGKILAGEDFAERDELAKSAFALWYGRDAVAAESWLRKLPAPAAESRLAGELRGLKPARGERPGPPGR